LGGVGFVFFDYGDLIFGVEPASQVHELAPFGAEGVEGAGFVTVGSAYGALANGARGVGAGGIRGHIHDYSDGLRD
jgi:hypothetical protein